MTRNGRKGGEGEDRKNVQQRYRKNTFSGLDVGPARKSTALVAFAPCVCSSPSSTSTMNTVGKFNVVLYWT